MQPISSPPVARVSRTVDKRTDFFIAGNSKSGTSALYFFLDQHPEVCMSSPKEPNFFATDFCHDQDMGAFTRKSASDYRGFFDDPTGTLLRGEASACYLYSKEAAANIAAHNPEAGIIAIFREPVSFLHSYHLQQLKNPVSEGETVKDFETALALESDRRAGKSIPAGCLIPELLFYSERIKYTDHLARFYDHFSKEQVLVLLYEDFKADNQAIYKEILEFIGVAPDHQPTFRRHNVAQKLRSKTAQRFVHRLSHGNGAWSGPKKLIKGLLPPFVRQFLLRTALKKFVFEPKDAVSPGLRQKLMEAFKPEVKRFGKLIGRDVEARWGYDSI
jgi:hypothetical protein